MFKVINNAFRYNISTKNKYIKTQKNYEKLSNNPNYNCSVSDVQKYSNK